MPSTLGINDAPKLPTPCGTEGVGPVPPPLSTPGNLVDLILATFARPEAIAPIATGIPQIGPAPPLATGAKAFAAALYVLINVAAIARAFASLDSEPINSPICPKVLAIISLFVVDSSLCICVFLSAASLLIFTKVFCNSFSSDIVRLASILFALLVFQCH